MTKICLGLESIPLARSNGASRTCTTIIFITPQQTLNCDKRIHIASTCLHWSRNRESDKERENSSFLFMFVHSILSCPTWSKTKGVTVQWNNIRSFLWGRDYRKLHLEVYFSPPETLRHCWPYFALLGRSSTSWNPNKIILAQVQTHFITNLCKTVILSRAFKSQMLYTTYLV